MNITNELPPNEGVETPAHVQSDTPQPVVTHRPGWGTITVEGDVFHVTPEPGSDFARQCDEAAEYFRLHPESRPGPDETFITPRGLRFRYVGPA